jgi:hypothetical protein
MILSRSTRRILSPLICLVAMLGPHAIGRAGAIVQGDELAPNHPAASWTVMVVGENGRLCSGALVGPAVVLTAAHCVQGAGRLRIEAVQPNGQPLRAPVLQFEAHPSFQPNQQPRFQPGADLALVLLGAPIRDIDGALEIEPNPVEVGKDVTIFGFGAAQDRDQASARVLRGAVLEHAGVYRHSSGATAQFAQDRAGKAQVAGAGACGGDSGGPVVFGNPEKGGLVGIITWAAGPTPETRCGGYTAFVPLARHYDWLLEAKARLIAGNSRRDPIGQLEMPPPR